MTPEALAALHARCFDVAPPPWSAAAFAGLLAEPACFLLARPLGFALGRAAAGEAELLTIAVAPEARGRGEGAGLLAGFEAEAARRGAAEAFLEVAEDNAAARALYARAGFAEAGRRPGYYRRARAPAIAALTLCKRLAPVALEAARGKTD
ncbi:GNAT family N-acetyltransferase [Amaricoccus sp.]|uniref:GNAT family N-acetyltransferase n=1 Tax=Amaricoccus sp. TaxID=1872485 RepID=UPI001B458F9C|nr:GNAT family N-acetyltransferase [Amaricoccus sp.]MBP7002097.1 GNAT family N-acetyltransferase [Amaricoccus sp.]